MRLCRRLVALGLIAAFPAAAQYTHVQPSHDGTGIVYMNREIAHVMGHLGAGWLERPEREREEQPAKVLSAMQLRANDIVADIGAGTGYFSTRIARKIPLGRVLAVDIQPEMIAMLKSNIQAKRLKNIEPVLGTPDDPHLPASGVDKILMVDAYHEFDQPLAMMQNIVKNLRPGGEVVLVEYRGEDQSIPILPHHKMTVEQVNAEMAAVGLHLVRRNDELPMQHILIYGR